MHLKLSFIMYVAVKCDTSLVFILYCLDLEYLLNFYIHKSSDNCLNKLGLQNSLNTKNIIVE